MNITEENAFRMALVKTIRICRNGSAQNIIDHARYIEDFLKKNKPSKSKIVQNKIIDFFTKNSDEELTISDISTKFSCSKDIAKEAINNIGKSGLLNIKIKNRIRIYSFNKSYEA